MAIKHPTSRSTAEILTIFLALLGQLSVWYRLRFGVDLFDEAFYAALPYGWWLGRRPFIDESVYGQAFSFFTYPWVAVFIKFTGGTDGLIYFLREVYFFFAGSVSILLFLCFRKLVNPVSAFAIAFSFILFTPMGLFSCSYNTLSFGFFTVSACVLGCSLDDGKFRGEIFFSGLATALAAVAHPALAPLMGFMAGLVFLKFRSGKRRFLFMGGIVIGLLPILGFARSLFLAWGDAHRVAAASGYRLINLTKIANLGRELLIIVMLTGVAAWLFYEIEKRFPRWRKGCLIAAPLWPFAVATGLKLGLSGYCLCLGLFAPALLRHLWNQAEIRRALWLVAPASALAGACVSYTSNLGLDRFSGGFLPMTLFTLILLSLRLNREFGEGNEAAGRWGNFAVIALHFLLVLHYPWDPYDDSGLKTLTRRVDRGPYAGLYTSPEKASYLDRLRTQISPLLGKADGGRLFCYDNFPAGYLFSGLRPTGGSLWTGDYSDAREFQRVRYAAQLNQNDRVLRIRTRFYGPNDQIRIRYREDDTLNRFVQTTHRVIYSDQFFTVYAPDLPHRESIAVE